MTRLLERVFLVCGIIVILDLAFFGPGLALPGLGISLRRLLLLVMFAAAVIRRSRAKLLLTRDDAALLAFLFVFVLLWAVVLPKTYGFPLGAGLSDVSPWLALGILAVWPWDAWSGEWQWERFRRFLVRVCVVLALLHLLIWALLAFDIISGDLLALSARLVAGGDDDSEGFIRIASVGNTGQYRVYWSSSIFLLGSVYFLIAYRPRPLTKRWLAALILICAALWATYIRAFLGAIAIFLLLAPFLRKHLLPESALPQRIKILAVWLVGILGVGLAINPTLLDSLGLAREVSDVERVEQATALLDRFESHPLLGTGFGSYTTQSVRSEGAPHSYELVFHALLMKLGVFGILVLLVILFLALRVARPESLEAPSARRIGIWTAFTTGFWFAGATNPMVTNFAGMGIMLLLLVDMHRWQSDRSESTTWS